MNPAERIREILKTAKEQEPQATVSQAWANTFKIPQSKDANLQCMEVLPYLSLLGAEFSLLQEYINQDNSLAPDLTGSPMGGVQSILGSVTVLGSQWQPFRDRINENLLRDLGWISREFNNKGFAEEKIPEGELENLLKEISELEEIIEKSNLSPPVRRVILHHIEIIRRAIRHYPIIGALAFKNAVVEGYGEAKIAKESLINELNKEENSEVRSKFKAVWERTATNMGKISKSYGYGRMIYDLGSKGIELIEGLIS